jgi:hypothetical protein
MKKKMAIMALLCASAHAMNGGKDPSPRKMVVNPKEAVETNTSLDAPTQKKKSPANADQTISTITKEVGSSVSQKKEEEEEKTGPINQSFQQKSTFSPFQIFQKEFLRNNPQISESELNKIISEIVPFSLDQDFQKEFLRNNPQISESKLSKFITRMNIKRVWEKFLSFSYPSNEDAGDLKDPTSASWQESMNLVGDVIKFLKEDIWALSSPVIDLLNIKISREDVLKALEVLYYEAKNSTGPESKTEAKNSTGPESKTSKDQLINLTNRITEDRNLKKFSRNMIDLINEFYSISDRYKKLSFFLQMVFASSSPHTPQLSLLGFNLARGLFSFDKGPWDLFVDSLEENMGKLQRFKAELATRPTDLSIQKNLENVEAVINFLLSEMTEIEQNIDDSYGTLLSKWVTKLAHLHQEDVLNLPQIRERLKNMNQGLANEHNILPCPDTTQSVSFEDAQVFMRAFLEKNPKWPYDFIKKSYKDLKSFMKAVMESRKYEKARAKLSAS